MIKKAAVQHKQALSQRKCAGGCVCVFSQIAALGFDLVIF